MKARAFLLAAALISVAACAPRKGANEPDAAFSEFISAYTGGVIDEGQAIRIDLAADIPAEREWTEGLFAFTPPLKGTTRWASPSTVIFTPEDLTPGKSYEGSFMLGKVMDTGKDFGTFRFGFTVKRRAAEAPEEKVEGGKGFRVVSSKMENDRIDIVLSAPAVNAASPGMVELSGVARSYIQVTDSLITVFYEGRNKDEMVLRLDKSVKDAKGSSLGKDFVRTFRPGEEKPAVEILLDGTIMPDSKNLILPFRAVNLSAVELRIVKIYQNNILRYLQDNDLGEDGALRRCGRLVWKGDVPLDEGKDLHKWNEHAIDLGPLIRRESGAIYRIRISFRLDQSLYGGLEPARTTAVGNGKPTARDEKEWDTTSPWYWDSYGDWSDYHWKEADDPTKQSYYMDSERFPSVRLLCSEIGLIAKYSSDGRLWVGATDLNEARPLGGCTLEVYDYQLQRIALAKSDPNSMTEIAVPRRPFVVVAKKGNSQAYLKVNDGSKKSLSRFDVGGVRIEDGLKAFIYGERGVWRPGDTLHVNMILSSKGAPLPDAHPVTMELRTPEGQFYSRMVAAGTDGFYSFNIPTRADDPTGYWQASFKAGGTVFRKTLHIETIRPNRLKVSAHFLSPVLEAGKTARVSAEASWLTGGPAAGMKVSAEMNLRTVSKPFKGFEKYIFSTPGLRFSFDGSRLFSGTLNEGGNADIVFTAPKVSGAPGMLEATLVTSVDEPGGGESFTVQSMPFSPYTAYVGLLMPDDEFLTLGRDHKLKVAVLAPDGSRVKGHELEYAVFKTGWNWWWDNPGGDLDAWVSGPNVTRVAGGRLVSSDSDAGFTLDSSLKWGRYLILVKDRVSGHTTGTFTVIDDPEWYGRTDSNDPENLTMLSFATGAASYKAGEKAVVFIPAAPGGQALVSLENASGVISSRWIPTGSSDTSYSFDVTPEMAPNFYVHITLVRPASELSDDVPIRLYGVRRIVVEDPLSHLSPQISMEDTIHPEQEFTVRVSEKDGKPMTYTLAIVDEGLLDITAFKTPDPWSFMYRVEQLGVDTWDLFDLVAGARTGKLHPIAAVGGDQENIVSARKDNRFNPVVLALPPKMMKKGGDVLKLKLPQYVGSVRVMVVAAHGRAFGSTDKTVSVKAPLMVVSTLPRVLGTGESVTMPVNVFATDPALKQASVSVKCSGPLKVSGPASAAASFGGTSDTSVSFALSADGTEGIARVHVEASGAGFKTAEDISIEVRNPNPPVHTVRSFKMESGAKATLESGLLQISGFPCPDAGAIFRKMEDYPYDCTEQLSARGLTLLYLAPILGEDVSGTIPGIISKIYARQGADGGFGYWPGGYSHSWVSSMAGFFLASCRKQGYEVSDAVLKDWVRYQKKMSQAFRIAGNSIFSNLDEAFRLYSLVVAGEAQVAAMNRLGEASGIGDQAAWALSSALALSGRQNAAREKIKGISREIREYSPESSTFGTPLRDRLFAMEALALTGDVSSAMDIAREIPSATALSTQEACFASVALSRLWEQVPTSVINVKVGNSEVKTAKSMVSVPVTSSCEAVNNSDGPVWASLVTTSREPVSKEISNSLKLDVRYVDENGAAVNPSSLKQGTVVKVTVKVSNLLKERDIRNVALDLPVPSGWEIRNERLFDDDGTGYDYKDVRDDRVRWFFNLPARTSRTFTLKVRAAYEGSYILPAVTAEAMYEPSVSACTASGKAVVSK